MSRTQKQTENAFAFKWSKRETYEGDYMEEKHRSWLVQRYFGSEEELNKFQENFRGKRFLDAGCGSGFSALALFREGLGGFIYTGIDISDAVSVAETRLRESGIKGHFLKTDIGKYRPGEGFDVIFSEGVLHHTDKPYKSFKNLVRTLNPGGKILFYVYKKKAPMREYADDLIREKLNAYTDEESWERLLPLTRLGKKLGELNAQIHIEEDIDLLGIPGGEYDLQRFFYWFFVKAFYDPSYTMEQMNHINFDWYRPSNAFRFDPEEIREWVNRNKLKTDRFYVDESGISVVASK